MKCTLSTFNLPLILKCTTHFFRPLTGVFFQITNSEHFPLTRTLFVQACRIKDFGASFPFVSKTQINYQNFKILEIETWYLEWNKTDAFKHFNAKTEYQRSNAMVKIMSSQNLWYHWKDLVIRYIQAKYEIALMNDLKVISKPKVSQTDWQTTDKVIPKWHFALLAPQKLCRKLLKITSYSQAVLNSGNYC